MTPLLLVLLALVFWGLIFGILWWGWGKLALGEPFQKIGQVILIIATVFTAIGILLGNVGPPPFLAALIQ